MSIGSFLVAMAVAVSVRPVLGQEARLKLDDLVAEALRKNPEILAAQRRYQATQYRPAQEGSLPDPMLSLGYTSSGSPWPVAGIGREPASNAGIMVSQEFPWPGKRKLRGEIATKEAEAELEEYRAVELGVVSRLKQAYHRLDYTYETARLLEANRDLLRGMTRISEARYSIGRAPQQDIFQAQTQLSVLETRILQIEQERRSAEAEINSLLARPPSSVLGKPVDVSSGATLPTIDELYDTARENSPLLRRARKETQKNEVTLALARKEYYPDYTVSAGYFNMGGMPDMYEFRIGFKLPAWFRSKQRSAVAEESQSLAQARHSVDAADQAIRFRVRDEYLAAQASERLVKMYADTIIPQAQLAFESSLASYQTGAVDFLAVFTSLMAKVEYEENFQQQTLSLRTALARLEETTGKRLTD